MAENCSNCPQKQEQEKFEQELTAELETVCKGKWQKWGTDNLLKTVLDIAEAKENLPRDRQTIKTARLIEALEIERRKVEKAELAKSRQQTAS
jgi:hypothetical protein